MRTRIENLKNKNKMPKKPARGEEIVRRIIIDLEVFSEEEDRGILLKKLSGSNACIAMGIFQSAIIMRVRNKKVREILIEKLAMLKEVRSNENVYIFITSPKYNTEVLKKITKGVVNKVKQEQERDYVRSLIFIFIPALH